MMAAPVSMVENIRKYEEIGTHPAANHNAIGVAVAFNRAIGLDRKAARLRFLRDRWAKRLQQESARVQILTPLDDKHSCGIAMIHVDGLDTSKLQEWRHDHSHHPSRVQWSPDHPERVHDAPGDRPVRGSGWSGHANRDHYLTRSAGRRRQGGVGP